MTNSPLTYALTALLCAAVLFSCTFNIEQPQFNEQNSSSGTEQPPMSRKNDLSNSSTAIVQSSSQVEQPPISSPTQSSPSVPKSSSSPALATGCQENNPKAGFTCGWNVTTNLVPGASIFPIYSGEDDCSIAWKYKDNSSPFADCLQTNDNGLIAEGSKTYSLFAELNCGGSKHINACNPKAGLSSKTSPYLTGECRWAKNPTTTARGGNPSGVTVTDMDNVCGATKSVVYKYDDGYKTWPSTGILPEWKSWDKKHKETYEVEATLNCPAYDETVTVPCPPLEVTAGTDYLIECNGGFQDASCGGPAKRTVSLKLDECVEINVINYTDQLFLPDKLLMRCEAQGAQNNLSLTLALNGKAQTFTGSWSWNGDIILGKMKLGDNEFGTLCVTALNGAASVRCTGPSL